MGAKFVWEPEENLVQTDKGLVQGYEFDGIKIFKGIPYAKAKRFHAPEEADAWEGEFDATNYGRVCPLINPNEKPMGELGCPHRYWPQGEDCLNLNVWTPGLDDKKRPVVFWMHGGGFEAGSSIEQVVYEGGNPAKLGDLVFVSVNHRINVLGFYDFSEFGEEYKNSANNGMLDIIMALKWVSKNIAAFGGDPDNVTVVGQSGGGAKVTTLLQMPAADGLFHKGINMSGVIGPILADGQGSGKEMAQVMMKELGISTMKEMEEVEISALMSAYAKVRPAFQQAGKYNGGTPKKNQDYYGEPTINGFRPETADIPLMVGSTIGEFFGFFKTKQDKHKLTREEARKQVEDFMGKEDADRILPLFEAAYPERCPLDVMSLDSLFRGPEIAYNKARAALNQATYVYLFDYDLPMYHGILAGHCSDIAYFFHNTDLVEYTQGDDSREMIEKQLFGALIFFARSGNPNHPDLPEWKPAGADQEYVMNFGLNPKLKCNYDHELVEVHAKTLSQKLFARMMGTQIQH